MDDSARSEKAQWSTSEIRQYRIVGHHKSKQSSSAKKLLFSFVFYIILYLSRRSEGGIAPVSGYRTERFDQNLPNCDNPLKYATLSPSQYS